MTTPSNDPHEPAPFVTYDGRPRRETDPDGHMVILAEDGMGYWPDPECACAPCQANRFYAELSDDRWAVIERERAEVAARLPADDGACARAAARLMLLDERDPESRAEIQDILERWADVWRAEQEDLRR